MTRASSIRCRFLPRFETLEDRTLMSTCHVTRLSDTGTGHSRGAVGDLRYCINRVNAQPGPDVIDFSVTGTINLTVALSDLASDIEIQGPGADLLTIHAQQMARIFYVAPGAIVNVSGLSLTGGVAPYLEPGGGIFNEGELTLQNCTVAKNRGYEQGGGIYNRGKLSILNSSISGNTVTRGTTYLPRGAGISNEPSGRLLIHGSLISENQTRGSYSSTSLAGGIYNLGVAVIVSSTIAENKATGLFGIGGGNAAGFGGGILNGGNLLIESSLVANNAAIGDYYGYGGGIANGLGTLYPDANVTIVNSTITGNFAFAWGDGTEGEAEGGGISAEHSGTVTLRNSTIAQNISNGSGSFTTGHGGGIAIEDSVLDMRNTILAGNQAKSAGPDFSGVLASSGYNLIQNSVGGSGYDPTDLLNVDPLLGSLTNNGGPTQTHPLLPGSPAIDAGDNTEAPEFDQRGPGFPRIVNGTIDIGAFEVQATLAPGITNNLGRPKRLVPAQ